MNVKFKKISENAVAPQQAHPSDAGYDLVAVSRKTNKNPEYIEYGTGLAIEIPDGYVGLIFPRSSVSKTSLCLRNSVGVIDSGYRGEIKLRFGVDNNSKIEYSLYDKVGQLVFMKIPNINLIESEFLSDSERGEGGFGSTGK
tara:strand:+ start:1991 stop:2416 length:426 start_codon:yes stop_codon:yes gene_type:complete